ncbi:MAG: aspartate/glutamate racemase family protein [Sedimentisphaerales bacterium]|nr:aspartate/glutamate racemase family protein [Sedimentisphaerales bacterium]
MKTIGLIGGMSWESTLEYYRIINEVINKKLGGYHSAQIMMYSFDFSEIAELPDKGHWDEVAKLIIGAARKLEKAGADVLLICTNTMHKVAEDVQKNIRIPLLHIADATAEQIKAKNITKTGLLGTRFTMEDDFYKERLAEKHGLETIVPDERERQIINNVIYNELCRGQIRQSSKEDFRKIMQNLNENGAEGIILGCTEICLLVNQSDAEIPIFDTTTIHAASAAMFALNQ